MCQSNSLRKIDERRTLGRSILAARDGSARSWNDATERTLGIRLPESVVEFSEGNMMNEMATRKSSSSCQSSEKCLWIEIDHPTDIRHTSHVTVFHLYQHVLLFLSSPPLLVHPSYTMSGYASPRRDRSQPSSRHASPVPGRSRTSSRAPSRIHSRRTSPERVDPVVVLTDAQNFQDLPTVSLQTSKRS